MVISLTYPREGERILSEELAGADQERGAARDLFSIVGHLGLLETEIRLFPHKGFSKLAHSHFYGHSILSRPPEKNVPATNYWLRIRMKRLESLLTLRCWLGRCFLEGPWPPHGTGLSEFEVQSSSYGLSEASLQC